MKTIVEQTSGGALLVSDGAWGTFLQMKGLKPGECPELWCVERRADVLEIARGYAHAGADMIETNSFGGSRLKLVLYGIGNRVRELNEAAAAISREAVGPDRHVIASIGPTGKFLLTGEVADEEMYQVFREQAVALESGGADACCIETMSAVDEAVIAVKAAKENTKLEVVCTFTFERKPGGKHRTMMGVSPAEAAVALSHAGADVIGTNCGNGMAQMVDIVKEMRAACPDMPILIHANAGMPVNVDGRDQFPETPEFMARLVPDAVAAGAGIVGGCCGTTPEHIAAIARVIKSLSRH